MCLTTQARICDNVTGNNYVTGDNYGDNYVTNGAMHSQLHILYMMDFYIINGLHLSKTINPETNY